MQFHHDGAFSASTDKPCGGTVAGSAPLLLLQMYCVEAPTKGGGTAAVGTLSFGTGATLLVSIAHAFRRASPGIRARARRISAVCTAGVGQIVEDEHPPGLLIQALGPGQGFRVWVSI